MTNEWPYDAPQDDPLTALRIPVTFCVPDHPYLVVFDRDSAERPTDHEADVIASYLEWFKSVWYSGWWQHKMLQMPFDIDGDMKTMILHKYGPDAWAYRHHSWTYGPRFVPERTQVPTLTLVQVLDSRFTTGTHSRLWDDWKAARPALFA